MVESVKKNLVAKFDNFDELYEQKILENEMVVKSLKSEIDAKCLELHETIDKNYLLLIKDADFQGEEIKSDIVTLKDEQLRIKQKLDEAIDERELFILEKEFNKCLEKLENCNYRLKFTMNDCDRCKNNVIIEETENRQAKRKRVNDDYDNDHNYIRDKRSSIVIIFYTFFLHLSEH